MNTAPKQSTRRERFASPEELFERYRQGDWEALEVLYDRFEWPLYRFAVRLLGSREDGADVLQDMWCRAHLHQGDWRTGTSVKSWFFGILRNLCFDQLRRRKHEPVLDGEEDEQGTEFQRQSTLADWYTTWSRTAFDPSFRRALEEGLQHLAPVYRVLLLYAFDDWSYAEMAEKEGISESQVKGRLYRAREQIKEYLIGCGYEPDAPASAPLRKRERHG
jgi:RNA polymerase sigma-70 factor (ECF subfamily)